MQNTFFFTHRVVGGWNVMPGMLEEADTFVGLKWLFGMLGIEGSQQRDHKRAEREQFNLASCLAQPSWAKEPFLCCTGLCPYIV